MTTTNQPTLWGIHAGRTGDADRLFSTESVVALGWPKVGDLSKLANNRDAFKAAVVQAYPDKVPGAIPGNAGQLYRLIHEAKVGDFVIYPSKLDRTVHIGQITGEYKYAPDKEPAYPNHRPVKWLKVVPRTSFTQGALYEIGSALSLFQVKNYADEFLAKIQKSDPAKLDIESEDAAVKVIAEEIQESTHDFVLKRFSQELKGHPLANFVAHLLNTMGYRTRISPPGADGGVDIIAHPDELGFQSPIIKVQVKSSQEKVGDATVKSLYGNVDSKEYGMFVTLGSFTPPARSFERTKSNLRLIDGVQLVDLTLEHYEQLDSRYKGLIPLKRIYVPQPIEESSE
jgi:restriction system protein